MKVIIDTEKKIIQTERDEQRIDIPLYSRRAFDILSELWLKVGWNEKYQYTFTWMGRPIIQNPEDIVRAQEVIYRVKPDIIIETGVAHGGSLIFYASLCKAIGKGRIVGIDIEIRPGNRQAIENHELFSYITLIEGSSTDPSIVEQIKSMVHPGESVLILLDSNHSKNHVLAELEAYHRLVTPGSYIVATDGVMKDLFDVPRGEVHWRDDNPASAAAVFVQAHPEFVIEQPEWLFNESKLSRNITHWPDAWIRRVN